MENKGKVSIVVPVYNAGSYLTDMVESVLAQEYSNFELILVDDGSTDGSGGICDKYRMIDCRVRVLHQENQGVSVARNVGIEACTGEYLLFCDADDILVKSAIKAVMKYMNDTNADVVIFGWKIIKQNGETEERFEKEQTIYDKEYLLKNILTHYAAFGGGYPWNKMWRIDAVNKKNQGIPLFNSELNYFEDLEWVVRMFLCTEKIFVCSDCLYKYYVRENSATTRKNGEENKEISYHAALQNIIKSLEPMVKLEKWFREKYYQELINGVIGAKRRKYNNLQIRLYKVLFKNRKQILRSNISLNLKARTIFGLFFCQRRW